MHYYQFNIADYRKDTTHLSMLEHGAYRQLLDWHYLEQEPIPLETEVVFRRLSARTNDERLAIEIVLKEMFVRTDEGYIQHRVMQEIDQYSAKADRARDNGKLGGRPKKTKEVISGNLEETQEKANSLTHKPNNSNINTLVISQAEDICPHQKIIDLYHEKLPMLNKVKIWNAKRQTQLRTRWKEEASRQSLDYWRELFEFISESDYLTGKINGWKADLEWITNSTNFTKIIEGTYKNRNAA